MATLSVPVQASVPTATMQSAARWLQVVSHTDPRYGGLSSAVPALAASMQARHGIEAPLAAFCLPGEQYKPQQTREGEISFWPTSRVAWMLEGELRRSFSQAVRAADGLHIHGLWEESTAIGCKLARRLGKPYVLSAHGMLEPWALATKQMKKRVYAALIERANVAGAACLHALTCAEAQQYRDFGARGPIAVIPNAVDLPEDTNGELFFARFPELRGKRIVLFLSRLHPKKGLDLLVAAWARAGKQHADAHLVIAGPDSDGMQATLTAQAVAAGIDHKLTFAGMLTGSTKWSALGAAEGYVLPSYSEGLSMALLEAMGMGVPVIATRACNMPEITSAGAGWEIEATVDALASAMGDLLKRPIEENWVMGRKGAELITSRYSPAQVARQMAEMYAFVLGGPRPEGMEFLPGGAR